MKVKQFYNKNQFIIEGWENDNEVVYFQSYDTTIAKVTHIYTDNGHKILLEVGDAWDYSKTTSKHFYLFLHDYVNITLGSNNKRKEFKAQMDGETTYNDYNVKVYITENKTW